MALGHMCADWYVSVTCSTCWLLIIVSRNYCYWRMYFWQLILYPLAVNIWLFVAFHCQRMCVLLSFSFVLESSTLWPSSISRILLKPQLNFILFNFNFSFFSSVGLNSVCIELFVNTGYFINVFFVYKLSRRRGFLKHGLCKRGFCSV